MERDPPSRCVSPTGFVLIGTQYGATRVLYDDSTGLTLLIRQGQGHGNDRELWRHRPPLAVVFSFECDDGWVTHLPIIETAHYSHVSRLRRLVFHYADSVGSSHRGPPESAFTPDTRHALGEILNRLSVAPQPHALDGFMAALGVCLDANRPRPRLRVIPGGLSAPA